MDFVEYSVVVGVAFVVAFAVVGVPIELVVVEN